MCELVTSLRPITLHCGGRVYRFGGVDFLEPDSSAAFSAQDRALLCGSYAQGVPINDPLHLNRLGMGRCGGRALGGLGELHIDAATGGNEYAHEHELSPRGHGDQCRSFVRRS